MDVAILGVGLADGGSEALADVVRDLDAGLAREDLDVADRVLGDAAAPAQEGNQPFRIQLTHASYERLMELPKQSFNDNTLIKLCANI